MLIVEQDKTYFVNFENVEHVTLGVDKEETEYAVIAKTSNDDEIVLGTYKTEERAKEVLQEITENYATSIDYKYNQTLFVEDLEEYRESLVYRMPES